MGLLLLMYALFEGQKRKKNVVLRSIFLQKIRYSWIYQGLSHIIWILNSNFDLMLRCLLQTASCCFFFLYRRKNVSQMEIIAFEFAAKMVCKLLEELL
jgi:hypothetical protein